MGAYFGKRMAIATGLGAVVTLLAGYGIDFGKARLGDPVGFYGLLFLVGAGSGFLGVFFLSRVPEPVMIRQPSRRLWALLSEPFRERNFRQILYFLGSWNFAINLAAPFFTVYMLSRLGLNMGLVMSLSVLSQLINVMFYRVWGRLADRFSNKSVLNVSGFLFIVSIFAWPFSTLPDKYVFTVPILIAIHVLAGISTAGVNLCSGNIALKSAPKGRATSFLAANAVVNGAAATVAPILAGLGADVLAGERLSLSLRWIETGLGVTRFDIPAFDLQGMDFLFVLAGILGLYALHRLGTVVEEGEVEEEIVVAQLYSEARKALRHVSSVAGLRHLTHFPYDRLTEVFSTRRRRQ
jgi:MFS family permease